MVGRVAVGVGFLALATRGTVAAATVTGSAPSHGARATQFRSLFSFDFTNGYGPNELLATGAGFVGTAYGGGNSGNALACSSLGCGLIFSFVGGKYQMLYRFSGPDGANPAMGLIPGASGTYFGTTYYGGGAGDGTVFQFSGNQLTTLYSFERRRGRRPADETSVRRTQQLLRHHADRGPRRGIWHDIPARRRRTHDDQDVRNRRPERRHRPERNHPWRRR